jgi:cysteine desulfurase/selenocysteine lyase
VIFTRGTTEGGEPVGPGDRAQLEPGDEILVTEMEHHSNLIPWQMACRDRGARLVAVPVLDGAHLDMASFERLLSRAPAWRRSLPCPSVLGTINPVAEMTRRAHAAGALNSRWTARRRYRICRWTWAGSGPTFTSSPATRWSGPRASVCSTDGAR